MTVSTNQLSTPIEYPDEDGKPMAESDQAREYLLYVTKVLSIFFQERSESYVSGNLFIYYEAGNSKAVIAPDVFVIFRIEKRKRRSYKIWEEEAQRSQRLAAKLKKLNVNLDDL